MELTPERSHPPGFEAIIPRCMMFDLAEGDSGETDADVEVELPVCNDSNEQLVEAVSAPSVLAMQPGTELLLTTRTKELTLTVSG